MNRKEGFSTEEILAHCQSKVADAVGWNTKLSKEREKVTDYYNGTYPKRVHAGSASYVDQQVFVKVSQMRNQLVETFSGTTNLVAFDSFNPADQMQAEIQTEYCSHVLFKKNPGHSIIRDVIHDGLVSRVGIARVYWDKDTDEEELEFDDITAEELQAWQQDPKYDKIEPYQNEDGTFYGRMVETKDKGRIVIESVNPEEFFIEPQAKMISPEYYCGTRTTKTISWVRANYPKKVDALKDYNFEDDLGLRNSPEVISRFDGTDQGVRYAHDDSQTELRHVMVTELFTKIMCKGELTPSLHRVVFIGNVLLECEPVSGINLLAFVPMPVPHTFYGDSFAARIMPYQDILTSITRQVLDHAAITNNPRMLVRVGGLKNPRELLDNRLGGIVNVSGPDAVTPMQQAALNPYVFSLMQGMGAKIEEVSGISALSQGLNKDAVSQQNSAGLIEQLMSAGMVGQKQIARNFVDQFLIPLYQLISNLVITHETDSHQIQVTGGSVRIDPASWRDGRSATAAPHLGFGERDSEAQKITQFIGAVKEAGADRFMGPEGEYAVIQDILTLQGRKNSIARWFPITPDKIQPPQPDPMMMAEVELKKAQAQSHMMDAQSNAKKIDLHGQIAAAKQKYDELKAMMDHKVKEEGEHRRNMETMNRIDVSQREMHLTEQTPADMAKAIISPNG